MACLLNFRISFGGVCLLLSLVMVALTGGCGGEESTPTPTPAPIRISAVNLYSAKPQSTEGVSVAAG